MVIEVREKQVNKSEKKIQRKKGASTASVNQMTLGRLDKHHIVLAQNTVTISTNDPESVPRFSIIE